MLKINVDMENSECSVICHGTGMTAVHELGYAVREIYRGFMNEDAQVGEALKQALCRIFGEEDIPVWLLEGEEDAED